MTLERSRRGSATRRSERFVFNTPPIIWRWSGWPSSPTARGQGIARALLAYLEDLARHSHRLEVSLGVRLSLPRNVELYRRLGYHVLSVYPYPEGMDTWALLTKSVDGVPDHTPG